MAFKFVDLTEKDSITGFANRNIWAKKKKNEVFKSALKYIGPKYTEDYLLDYEDTIMTVSLFRVARSYYYMNECGYYRARYECESPFPFLKSKKCKNKNFQINIKLDPIKYLNFLLDSSNGKEIENQLIFKELLAVNHYKKLDKLIYSNFSYIYSIIDKIDKLNFHSSKMKSKISMIKHNLLKKQYY